MTDKPELKPCPFCGNLPGSCVDLFRVGEGVPAYSVGCVGAECPVRPSCYGETREHAALRWNTRTEPRSDWTVQQILDHAG